MRLTRSLAPILGLIAGAAAAQTPPPGPAPAQPGKIVAAWSVITPSTGAPPTELRIAVRAGGGLSDAALCASYTVAATAAGGGVQTGLALAPRTNPAPSDFPIAVCTLAMDPSWTAAEARAVAAPAQAAQIWDHAGPTGALAALPGPHMIGRRRTDAYGAPELRVATLADTGCRGKVGAPGDRSYQDCADWQFATIAASITADAPDLVIHAGDYRYFWEGGSNDPSASPDTWAYWLQDFFAPAQALLLDAPWAFARGNHEVCDWYGTGFSFLLGTGGPYCDGNDAAPWAFDAAPGGDMQSAAHRFVMLDTSQDWQAAALEANFTAAIGLSSVESSWWISHIPAYARLKYRRYVGDAGVRAALLNALAASGATLCDPSRQGAPACRPSAVIQGHQHLFQQLAFFAPGTNSGAHVWPLHVIAGHGGVSLDHADLGASPCSYDRFDIGGPASEAAVHSRSEHGYVLWTRTAADAATGVGWRQQPRRADGSAMALAPVGPNMPVCN